MEWETRMEQLWAAMDQLGEAKFLAAMETLLSELPEGSAIIPYEWPAPSIRPVALTWPFPCIVKRWRRVLALIVDAKQ